MTPIDPRAAQALHSLSNARALLIQYERLLSTPGALGYFALEAVSRAMRVTTHELASVWNAHLAAITLPTTTT